MGSTPMLSIVLPYKTPFLGSHEFSYGSFFIKLNLSTCYYPILLLGQLSDAPSALCGKLEYLHDSNK